MCVWKDEKNQKGSGLAHFLKKQVALTRSLAAPFFFREMVNIWSDSALSKASFGSIPVDASIHLSQATKVWAVLYKSKVFASLPNELA